MWHKLLEQTSPIVMGILNVTPDSFFDGGQYTQINQALQRAEQMVKQGAKIIDIGGQSTRPQSIAIEPSVEIERTEKVVKAVYERFGKEVLVSIDTSEPEVMARAIDSGAGMVNDVFALQKEGALTLIAASAAKVAVCLMHMQKNPQTMQKNPKYSNVVDEVKSFLTQRVEACLKAGISLGDICVDVGFGFGKNLTHNLSLLKNLNQFNHFELEGFDTPQTLPSLVGISQKSMLGKILKNDHIDRQNLSVLAAFFALEQGVKIIRCHDVAATFEAVQLHQALYSA